MNENDSLPSGHPDEAQAGDDLRRRSGSGARERIRFRVGGVPQRGSTHDRAIGARQAGASVADYGQPIRIAGFLRMASPGRLCECVLATAFQQTTLSATPRERGATMSQRASPVRMLCAVLLGVALAPAVARADAAANDILAQAEGPAGTSVTGTLPAGDPADWYVFYVAGQQQLHISLASTTTGGGGYPCDAVSVYDTDGNPLSTDYTTAPGINRYFLEVTPQWDLGDISPCVAPSNTYMASIAPAGALVSEPPMDTPIPTSEPNENPAHAIGPLRAGVSYAGTLATTNDQDWFVFYLSAGTHQLDISALGANQPSDSCTSSQLTLYTSAIASLASVYAELNQVQHIRQTLTGPGRYYLAVTGNEGCVGTAYQLRIGPVGALAPTPAPARRPSRACRADRSAAAMARRAVSHWAQLAHRYRRGARHRIYLQRMHHAQRQLQAALKAGRRDCH